MPACLRKHWRGSVQTTAGIPWPPAFTLYLLRQDNKLQIDSKHFPEGFRERWAKGLQPTQQILLKTYLHLLHRTVLFSFLIQSSPLPKSLLPCRATGPPFCLHLLLCKASPCSELHDATCSSSSVALQGDGTVPAHLHCVP